ncbi:protein kinase [Ideonella sp. 4Y16]|uniref:serine/threonine protein kinase n=1 Tax=Ideonella alba TaxID=2824118 RepID=UPI001B369470|nr:serine/threonine-protein kinase [Ideonella alba]MBQ0946243.1 protein kinase [Ideonella alba]
MTLPSDDDDRTVIRPVGASSAPTPAAPPAPAPAPQDGGSNLPIGTYLGEFELTGVLGEGGFGIVYLAWDHSLERRVALKEYMPSSLAMRVGATQVQVKSQRHQDTFAAGMKSFINEAKLLAQFDHPSLVKVYRFWEANGTAYMVMPFYEGITLKDWLRNHGSAPDETWLMTLLAPLTEALAVIHRENCFHRDIAPDNVILLAGSERPLLLDFGAARRVIGDMTQALTVILKPGYAPVEQYAESPDLKQGPWTDVYALAASIYYAITGSTPPPSVSRIVTDGYKPIAQTHAGQYSESFLTAIDKALGVLPDQRTPSIDDFRADLGLGEAGSFGAGVTLMPSAPAPSRASPTSAPAPAPAKRGMGLWVGAGVAGLAVLGAVGYLALGRSPAPAPAPSAAASAAPIDTVATPAPPPVAMASAPETTPAATPVATPPAPAAQASLSIASEFDRVLRESHADVQVSASAPKTTLKIDRDDLVFGLRSSQNGFATVLALGPDNSLIRLLPDSLHRSIPVVAGKPLRLPPDRIPIGDPPGPTRLLVIVTPEQRDFSTWGGREEGGYLSLPTDAGTLQRVVQEAGAVSPLIGRARNCSTPDCARYGAAEIRLDIVR